MKIVIETPRLRSQNRLNYFERLKVENFSEHFEEGLNTLRFEFQVCSKWSILKFDCCFLIFVEFFHVIMQIVICRIARKKPSQRKRSTMRALFRTVKCSRILGHCTFFFL